MSYLVLKNSKQMYEDGSAAVGGDSAGGTALTGSVMPVSGESYNSLLDGAHPEDTGDDADLVYDPDGGMGFMPGYIFDTHFTQVLEFPTNNEDIRSILSF